MLAGVSIDTTRRALKAVLETAGPDGITAREWLERSIALMGDHMDVDQLLRDMDLEPDDIIKRGPAFTRSLA